MAKNMESYSVSDCDKMLECKCCEEAYEKGKADVIDEVLDTIKNQRMIYYLALANGGNDMDDFAWEIASRALDNIAERLKEKKND